MLDRMMITCSVLELSVRSSFGGPSHLTQFQWVMLALLVAKLIVSIGSWQKKHSRSVACAPANCEHNMVVEADQAKNSDA